MTDKPTKTPIELLNEMLVCFARAGLTTGRTQVEIDKRAQRLDDALALSVELRAHISALHGCLNAQDENQKRQLDEYREKLGIPDHIQPGPDIVEDLCEELGGRLLIEGADHEAELTALRERCEKMEEDAKHHKGCADSLQSQYVDLEKKYNVLRRKFDVDSPSYERHNCLVIRTRTTTHSEQFASDNWIDLRRLFIERDGAFYDRALRQTVEHIFKEFIYNDGVAAALCLPPIDRTKCGNPNCPACSPTAQPAQIREIIGKAGDEVKATQKDAE